MTRDQKTISFIIIIVYTFIVLIGSCSHMFKQPYVDPVLKNAFDEWVNQCYDALNDDFNSPRLIAKLFDLYKIVQDIKIRNKHINSKNLKILKKFFPIFYSEILGLDDNTSSNVKYDAILNLILELREKERLNKNYKTSDYIRDQLQEFGVNINDKK